MPRRLLAAVLIAVAAVAATATGAKKAPRGASCSLNGRYMPGGGKLEWKDNGHLRIRLRGFVGDPVARTGDTLIFGGVEAINGSRRHGIAAIDMRSGRPLAFDPIVPEGSRATQAAASPTTAFIAYGEDGPSAPQEIGAFDLTSGARLPGFAIHDFDDGVISSVLYMNGAVIVSGGPASGDGITLGAYDPATGDPLWRRSVSELDLLVGPLATNGKLLFTAVPGQLIAALDPHDGSVVPGWGSAIDSHAYAGAFIGLTGADEAHVFGSTARGEHAGFVASVIVSAADGRPATLKDLPRRAGPLAGGIGPTILGFLKIDSLHFINAVYGPTGRLIGTVCSSRHLVIQRDARHLIATRELVTQNGSRLLELARPRR